MGTAVVERGLSPSNFPTNPSVAKYPDLIRGLSGRSGTNTPLGFAFSANVAPNCLELSRQANSATFVGTTKPSRSYWSFDGTGDRIDCGIGAPVPDASASTVDRVVAVWFRGRTQTSTDTTVARPFVAQGAGVGGVDLFWMGMGRAGHASHGKVYLNWGKDAGEIVSSATYNDGEWHLAVGVLTGTTTELFVDGVSVGTGTGDTVASSPAFSIGGSSTIAARVFSGDVSDVLFYFNRTFTEADAARLYSLGPNGEWARKRTAISLQDATPAADPVQFKTLRIVLPDTAGDTVDAVDDGFGTVAACIVLLSEASQATGHAPNALLSVGFGVGSSERLYGIVCRDSESTTDTTRFASASRIAMSVHDSQGLNSDFSLSAVTDGVRLTMQADSTGANRVAHVMLIGGTEVQAAIGDLTTANSVGGTATVSGLAFRPDHIFTLCQSRATNSHLEAGGRFGFGACDSKLRQRALAMTSGDNVGAANSAVHLDTEYGIRGNTGSDWTAEITAITDDGFTVTTRDAVTAGDIFGYLALSFGGRQSMVRTLSSPDESGNGDEPTIDTGFRPGAIFSVGSLATTTDADNDGISVSAYLDDGSDAYGIRVTDEDAASPSSTASHNDADLILSDDAGTELARAEPALMLSSGFRRNWSNRHSAVLYGWEAVLPVNDPDFTDQVLVVPTRRAAPRISPSTAENPEFIRNLCGAWSAMGPLRWAPHQLSPMGGWNGSRIGTVSSETEGDVPRYWKVSDSGLNYIKVGDHRRFRITGAITLAALIAKDGGAPTGDNEGIIGKYLGAGNKRSYVIAIEASTGYLMGVVSPDGTSTNATNLVSTTAIDGGEWHLVAMTYEPGKYLRLWVDGKQVSETTSSIASSIDSNNSELWLFCQYQANSKYVFAGRIAEAWVYDRAFTPKQMEKFASLEPGEWMRPRSFRINVKPTSVVTNYAEPVAYTPGLSYGLAARSPGVAKFPAIIKDISNSWSPRLAPQAKGVHGQIDGTLSSVTHGASGWLFDGTSSKINMGDVLGTTSPFTVSGWARPRSHDTQIVVSRAVTGGSPSYNQNYMLFERGSATNKWSFQVRSGATDNEILGSDVELDKWAHVVGVYRSGSDMELWVNGVLSATGGNGTAAANSVGQNFTIGSYDDGASDWFDGWISDVAFFDTDLYEAAIHELYRAGPHGEYARKKSTFLFRDTEPAPAVQYSRPRIEVRDRLTRRIPTGPSVAKHPAVHRNLFAAHVPRLDRANDLTGLLSGTLNNVGYKDDAWEFNGSSSYIDFGDVTVYDGKSQMTFSAWVYPTSNTSMAILSKYTNAGSQRSFAWQLSAGTSYLRPQLYFSADGSGSPDGAWTADGDEVPLNQWSHVAASWRLDGSFERATFTVNGVPVAATKQEDGAGLPNSILNTTATLQIGAREAGTELFFSGKIDELLVIDREFSPGELAVLSRIPRGESMVWRHRVVVYDATPAPAPPGPFTGAKMFFHAF